MKATARTIYILLAFTFVLAGAAPLLAESDTLRITKDELKRMLDQPGVTILDVRRGKDWTSSEFKIKGADYVDPGKYDKWVKNYSKNAKIVLYCA